MEGFWNVHDKNWLKPMVCSGGTLCALNKLYLHISGNISAHQSHTLASLADTTDSAVFSWAQHTGRQSPTRQLLVWRALILTSSSRFPLLSLWKTQVYKTPVSIFHSCSAWITSSPNIFTLLWVCFGAELSASPSESQRQQQSIKQQVHHSWGGRETASTSKCAFHFFKSKCQVSKAFLMVPNQAEILQPLWISKRSQDGAVCVSWVCANGLCKKCRISFLLFPWTSRSFHSVYARSRYMRHSILYFILFLPIIIIRNCTGRCKNPHVGQLQSSWAEEQNLIQKDLEVSLQTFWKRLHLCWNGFIWTSSCYIKILNC